MKFSLIITGLLILLICACEKEPVEIQPGLVGTWNYYQVDSGLMLDWPSGEFEFLGGFRNTGLIVFKPDSLGYFDPAVRSVSYGKTSFFWNTDSTDLINLTFTNAKTQAFIDTSQIDSTKLYIHYYKLYWGMQKSIVYRFIMQKEQ